MMNGRIKMLSGKTQMQKEIWGLNMGNELHKLFVQHRKWSTSIFSYERRGKTMTEKLLLLCAQHVCIDHNDIVPTLGACKSKKHLETLESKKSAVTKTKSYNVRLQRKQSIQLNKKL